MPDTTTTKAVVCSTAGCANIGAIVSVPDLGQEVQCGVCGALLSEPPA